MTDLPFPHPQTEAQAQMLREALNEMVAPPKLQLIDQERGIHYADGGTNWGTLCYPNPERIKAIHQEWEEQDGNH